MLAALVSKFQPSPGATAGCDLRWDSYLNQHEIVSTLTRRDGRVRHQIALGDDGLVVVSTLTRRDGRVRPVHFRLAASFSRVSTLTRRDGRVRLTPSTCAA